MNFRPWLLAICLLAASVPALAQGTETDKTADEKQAVKSADDKADSKNTETPEEGLFTRDLYTTDNDEYPFDPPQVEKRKNIFGDKNEKDAILKRMEYRIGFIAEGGAFNNADLRRLNESNQFTIQDTDDRINLAVSRFFLNLYFPITERLFFRVDLFKNGFWGNDQLSGRSSNNNSSSTVIGSDPFNFGELYLQGILYQSPETDLSLRIGRQYFEIGGMRDDYMLRDYLDAVTLQFAKSKLGVFRLLAIDVYQSATDATHHINYVSYFSHDEERIAYFNGDTSVLRSGLVYESPDIFTFSNPEGKKTFLQGRLYGFYARYGAVNDGGSDRTNLGSTGNFADNDFSILAGNRWQLKLQDLEFFADAAVSTGIDRKLPSATGTSQDIRNDGFAGGAGAVFSQPKLSRIFGLEIAADGFYASGPKYDSTGVQTSHGFVSFKGNQMGGFLVNKYWGAHPSAYTDDDGIDDLPFQYDRKSGSLFAHLGVTFILFTDLKLALDAWHMIDTGKSDITSPGTTPEKAQQRLGGTLGDEFNVSLDYFFNKFWSLYAKAGIFLPGSFYDSTNFISKDSPYGTDRFWGVLFGSKLQF